MIDDYYNMTVMLTSAKILHRTGWLREEDLTRFIDICDNKKTIRFTFSYPGKLIGVSTLTDEENNGIIEA